MASIQIHQYFTVTIDDREVHGGSLSRAKTINIADDEISDQTHKLAPEAIVKIWDKAENESLADFDFLWLESDRDVKIQLTTDAGGDDEYFVVELKGGGSAGVMGPALVLGSDLAHQFDGAVDAFDGTVDTIDEIWVENPSNTDTARVRIVVAT
jgi:hypothetical protein